MKRFAPILTCVAALLVPSVASAALSLQIGPRNGPPSVANIDSIPMLGRQFFDLIFIETAPTENEGLFAYDLLLTVPQSQRNKISLDGAERPPDNFVLDVPSGATFTVAESTADHVLINVSSNNDLADITTGKKAARIFYTLTPFSSFLTPTTVLTFNTDSTVFGSGDPNRPLQIHPDLSDTGVIGAPEPAGIALLGVAGLLALCRCRRA